MADSKISIIEGNLLDRLIRHTLNPHLNNTNLVLNNTNLHCQPSKQDNVSLPNLASIPPFPAKFQPLQCSTPLPQCMLPNFLPLFLDLDFHLSLIHKVSRPTIQATHSNNLHTIAQATHNNSSLHTLTQGIHNNTSNSQLLLKSPSTLDSTVPGFLSNHQYQKKFNMFLLLIGLQELPQSVI